MLWRLYRYIRYPHCDGKLCFGTCRRHTHICTHSYATHIVRKMGCISCSYFNQNACWTYRCQTSVILITKFLEFRIKMGKQIEILYYSSFEKVPAHNSTISNTNFGFYSSHNCIYHIVLFLFFGFYICHFVFMPL